MHRPIVDIQRRRTLLSAAAALAGLPLLGFARDAFAAGKELPHLTEDDPTAKALGYHNDAGAAPRTDKSGVPAKEQFCHNCQFIQSDSGDWRPCQIFPGKSVNANGWCKSWMPRPG